MHNKGDLNVWTAVWLRPKEAARYAIDFKPMRFAIILALIAGIFDMLNGASQNDLGDTMSLTKIFVVAIIMGPILGIIGWWISAGIATIVGTWLGGIGRFEELKKAFAITFIPVIVGGILWIPDLLLLGQSLFTEDTIITGGKFIWLLFSGTISFIIGVWGFVISIMAIAEAHQFSAWRGFWTVVIPAILIFIVVFIFFLPFIIAIF
ncbi:YIP1 family protein [Sporosarcina beigongshangi]|uniref:YIP1 family protein n=1 Tax=Sporosarcina beigongshangi TaxID=2782538 RepID=UPI00193A64C2|nr:Yip1 family protein [Sporosarcina beigongshangi]